MSVSVPVEKITGNRIMRVKLTWRDLEVEKKENDTTNQNTIQT